MAERDGRPRALTVASVVVALEALGLLAAALVLAVQAFTAAPASDSATTSTAHPQAVDAVLAGMALIVGAGLAACARGLAMSRGWARGPVVTWQLVQGAVAIQTLRGHGAVPMSTAAQWLVGLPLLLGALAVLAVVLVAQRPSSRPSGRGGRKGPSD